MNGDFTTKDNKTCSVSINVGTEHIGYYEDASNNTTNDGIFFAADPVVIKQSIDNTFTEIVKTECEIKLLTTSYYTELFTNNDRGIEVEVTVDNELKFKGYVTPNSYSQPYAEHLTEFTIQCQDYLSTLENHKYREDEIRNDKDNFSSVLTIASNKSFKFLLEDMGFEKWDLSHSIWYNTNIFGELCISEHILLGDTVDDVMTCEEILQEICKFLDIHAVMIADDLYFFDWETKQTTSTSDFADAVCSNDTTISIADVYNQLSLKCDVKDEDSVVESPTDDDTSYSDFTSKVKYETEFLVWGDGDELAQPAFVNIIQGKSTDYSEANCYEYYIQSMKATNWVFNYDSNITSSSSQTGILKDLYSTPYKCAMFSVGTIDRNTNSLTNDEPVSKIDSSNYLYISMPTNVYPSSTGYDNKTSDGFTNYNITNKSLTLSQSQMDTGSGDYLARYTGNTNGGALGATDDDTINYFVFSGKIILKTPYHKSGETSPITTSNVTTHAHHQLDQTKNTYGAFYGTKFYDDNGGERTGNSKELFNSNFNMKRTYDYATNELFSLTTYKSSTETDQITKVPVLKCKMSIGDYDLIETEYNVFEWVESTDTSKTNCLYSNAGSGDDSAYFETHKYDHIFTLGFNPAIGDYVYDVEQSIANTISYKQNIDAEGTAIPLPTGISGEITFEIISPVATVWTGYTCVRQPSTWNHSKWADKSCEIMPFVDSIIIKDFECTLASNDGNRTNYEEQDLIYVLGQTDNQLGIKDDIEFKFNTALTTSQATEAGQNSGAKLSNVIKDSAPFTGFYNDEDDKAEIRYINHYYNEYKEPHIIVETTLRTSKTNGYWENFTIPTLDGSFEVLAMEQNVRNDQTKYTLKQYVNS